MPSHTYIIACLGISWWKQKRIRSFLEGKTPLRFFLSQRQALLYADKKGGALGVWANRVTPDLQEKARTLGIPLYFIEDGFIRSIGLGSGFLPPSSIIVDRQGAYVDPSHPSDLETMLSTAPVSPSLHKRAEKLIHQLRNQHISKYAAMASHEICIDAPSHSRVILVPGQVAGDLSVVRGGGKITDNLALLREVQTNNPEAWIIYRPHPDVEAGHRPGALADKVVYKYANMIHRGGTMSSLLEQVHEVHTLTSLTGFEALLRNKKVTTYGAPFYAGWGLTTHLGPALPRRGRSLTMIDLAAITLILYPRYINPETGQCCEVEDLISCFSMAELWRPTLAMRLRKKQGQVRHFCARLFSHYRAPQA